MQFAQKLTQGRQLGAQRLWPPFRPDLPEPCFPTPTSPAPPPQKWGSAKAQPTCSPPHAAAAVPNDHANTKRRNVKNVSITCENMIVSIVSYYYSAANHGLNVRAGPLHEVLNVPTRERNVCDTRQPNKTPPRKPSRGKTPVRHFSCEPPTATYTDTAAQEARAPPIASVLLPT